MKVGLKDLIRYGDKVIHYHLAPGKCGHGDTTHEMDLALVDLYSEDKDMSCLEKLLQLCCSDFDCYLKLETIFYSSPPSNCSNTTKLILA